MNSILYFFTLLVLFFSGCQKSSDFNILNSATTYQLSFGADSISDKYLISAPRAICANKANDIYVLDEYYIKVFSNDGKEKTIFGGKGGAPNEFIIGSSPSIGLNGYLTVIDGNSRNYFSLFSPLNEFLFKMNTYTDNTYNIYYNNKGFSIFGLMCINSINEKRRFMEFLTFDNKSNDFFRIYNSLVYDDNSKLIEIVRYKSPRTILTERGTRHFDFRGIFLWDVSSDSTVFYTNPYIESNNNEYIINVYNVNTQKKQIIKHSYEPVIIPDNIKNFFDHSKTYPELGDLVKKVFNETKYYPAVNNILIDKDRLFVFKYNKDDKNDYLVDIFDISSGKYLLSVYFPVHIRMFENTYIIKNGFLYKIDLNEEKYFVIKKYKLNESIYKN
jgi:hypothetical protein